MTMTEYDFFLIPCTNSMMHHSNCLENSESLAYHQGYKRSFFGRTSPNGALGSYLLCTSEIRVLKNLGGITRPCTKHMFKATISKASHLSIALSLSFSIRYFSAISITSGFLVFLTKIAPWAFVYESAKL